MPRHQLRRGLRPPPAITRYALVDDRWTWEITGFPEGTDLREVMPAFDSCTLANGATLTRKHGQWWYNRPPSRGPVACAVEFHT